MNIVKAVSFKNTPYEYYQHPILTADEEDRNLLDTSMTNIQGFHRHGEYNGHNWSDGVPMMWFPKFHRGEKYQLPVNDYYIKQYDSSQVKIHFSTVEGYRCGEGRKIEIIGTTDQFDLEKVYSILNFEGRSWQHFMQDALPILMFGLDLLKKDPSIDILMYEPTSWIKDTFLEVMSYFNLDNKVVFVPYGAEIQLGVKTLYNFEADPTVPVCWWNSWFYEEANKLFSQSEKNENVIIIARQKSRYIENFDEISNILEQYALQNNLNFYKVDPGNLTPQELFSIFSKAHTVLCPNGGASFNMMFCNKNTKFIEVGFTEWSYVLYNLASGIKLKYYVIPIKGHNNTPSYHLQLNKIEKILND
jgi:capsular polysaccharide biosynthesis protein